MWKNIPIELKATPNWVCADKSKLPIDPKTGKMANPVDSSTWATFEVASAYAKHYSLYIGFVLSKEDPYAIIDLDNKPEKPATPEQLQRHQKILQAANSYTEFSISETGHHIILKGSVPSGCRKDNVEVYSDSRFMICTGNLVNGFPRLIDSNQPLLDALFNQMGENSTSASLQETDESLEDAAIVDMAMNASNADKFNSLCSGDQIGYPSQSEADLALLSILAFYTQSNEQVRRLFRMSALGKRDKAVKNDTYLNYALSKIRSKQPPPVDFTALIENAAKVVEREKAVTKVAESRRVTKDSKSKPNMRPPGLIGELMDYFYGTAIRPIPEVALTAAIAVTAGVCARSFNVSNSGLNQYIVLIAKTGCGKEGAASGIDKLLNSVRMKVPMVGDFRGPATFASGQGLMRWLSTKPCFFSILGEFGFTLQQLSDKRATSAEKMLKTVLLDIYAKSGWGRDLHSAAYSDSEKNTGIVNAPNVTILGESTPEAFFEGMDSHQVAQGLIPRFSIVEYIGDRPPRNRNAHFAPPEGLSQRFADLVAISLTATNSGNIIQVEMDSAADDIMEKFDDHSNDMSNNSDKSGIQSQMWTRAHLKAIKLAALVAVGINPHRPVITIESAQWAIDFVIKDTELVVDRFGKGDVGQGDSKQLFDLRHGIKAYLTSPPKYIKENSQVMELFKAKLIPYTYLSQRMVSIASYRNDRLGATQALKRNIQSMIDSGHLVEISKQDIFKRYEGYTGIVYGLSKSWWLTY